jgi:hypothetical protein
LRYTQARQLYAEFVLEEMRDIADDSAEDWSEDAKGHRRLDKEAVMRSRLRWDHRRWALAKLIPARFGSTPAPSGPAAEPGPAQPGAVQQHLHLHLTTEQRRAVTMALLAKARVTEDPADD